MLAHHRAGQALHGIGAVAGGQDREQKEKHEGGGGQRRQGRGHPDRPGSLARGAENGRAQMVGRGVAGQLALQPPAEGLVGEVVRVVHRVR